MNHRAYRWAMGMAFGSGMAALMHELLWTRRLIDLLGASAESSTRVFGCFFLGLALGAAIAGRISARVRRPWRMVAFAEGGVALLSLPVLFLPSWTQWLWPALGEHGLTGWMGGTVKFFVSVLTVLPPAVCMGMVLPLIFEGLPDSSPTGHRGIWLYAVNTCGGAAGLLVPMLFALRLLGVGGAMLLAAALNLIVAAGALIMDRAARPANIDSNLQTGERTPRWALAVAFFSGAAILATEVAATQMLMLVASLSFYAPAAILFAVIGTLAVAAFVVPAVNRRLAGFTSVARLALALGGAGAATALGPFAFMTVAQRLNGLAENASLTAFVIKLICLASLTIGPGILLAGLVFPLTISAALHGESYDARRLAGLLAINGVGGAIGAELAWRLLLPACGVHGSIGAVALAYAAAGAILAWQEWMPRGWRWAAIGAALVLLGAQPFLRALPEVNPRAGLKVFDHRAGREGTVAVVESDWAGRSILLSNQYFLGSSRAQWEQERQTHLPLLLHPEPRDVAFIGLATGITAGAALSHRGLRSIVAVELSPLVQRAAERFFGEFNHDITRSARARIVTEDGRTFIAACPGRFDVVIGDLFLPWAPGEARLFSLEHFRAVRQSLRPGGLYCQWLPMYQLTPRQFEVIAETFRAVFPRTALFCNDFTADTPKLALIGFGDDRAVDWPAVRRRCAQVRESGEVRDPLLRHDEGVFMVYLGELAARENQPSAVPLNTLGNLWIELDAARERLTGQPGTKYYFGSRWFRFCEERRAAMATPDRHLLDLAGHWMRWESARRHDPAIARALAATLRLETPHSLRHDAGADWQRWAGGALPWKPDGLVQSTSLQPR